jgi:putative FmdB family regulatory protein
MPLFEYRCADCGVKFDELVSSADESVACPKCRSSKTEKLLSVFAASVSSGSSSSSPSCARPGCGSGFS